MISRFSPGNFPLTRWRTISASVSAIDSRFSNAPRNGCTHPGWCTGTIRTCHRCRCRRCQCANVGAVWSIDRSLFPSWTAIEPTCSILRPVSAPDRCCLGWLPRHLHLASYTSNDSILSLGASSGSPRWLAFPTLLTKMIMGFGHCADSLAHTVGANRNTCFCLCPAN
jgi:hypothetical protein